MWSVNLRYLNGWHRLWVAAGGLWTMLVVAISVAYWPRPDSIPSVAVYRAMNPSHAGELRRFIDGPYGVSIMRANAPDDFFNDEARQGLANGTWREVRPPDAWFETTVEVDGRWLEFDPVGEAVRSPSAKATFREEVTRDFVSFLGPQASSFVPNSVKILAHRPPILKGFLAFVWATFGPGVLDERLKNLAALQTTLTNGCNY